MRAIIGLNLLIIVKDCLLEMNNLLLSSLSLSFFSFYRKFSKFAYHHKHIRKSDKEISYGERPYACADKESHTTSSKWRQKKRQSEYEELNDVNTKTCKKEILTALRSTISTLTMILISKWINEIFCINV